MARVFRARDTSLEVDRAVKLIPATGDRVRALARRLAVEARAMARLDHPNILAVYDIGEGEQGHWVVMDLAAVSLGDRLDVGGPMAPAEATLHIAQILDALESAHQRGIIHRDVKPSNILLDNNNRPLLADFGIALLQDDDRRYTRTGSTMGSVAYMAPEQRLDARTVDRRADVYAAASTLYHLVTGATPVDLFTAPDNSPRWHDVPAPLRPALSRATRLDPEERFPTAADFASALRAVIGDLPEGASITLPPRVILAPVMQNTATATATGHPGGSLTTLGVDPEHREHLPVAEPPPRRPGVAPYLVAMVAMLALIAWQLQTPPAAAPVVEALAAEHAPPAPEIIADDAIPAALAAIELPKPTPPPQARRAPRSRAVTEGASRDEPKEVAKPSPVQDSVVGGAWKARTTVDWYLQLAGPIDQLKGRVRTKLPNADLTTAATRPVRGSYDAGSGHLRLEEQDPDPAAGVYDLTLKNDGNQLVGHFANRNGTQRTNLVFIRSH